MDLIDGIRSFVAVAESGSFTAAGQALGISNKLAGKYVGQLEHRLGRSLFYRTTRAVSLTDEGARWLPHARKVLAALEEADAALHPAGEGPVGTLRLTCGTTLGELVVADAVRLFLARYPGMSVELHMSDSFTDLASGGFDMAVRIGILRDSTLRMRLLGATRMRIAASPAYLARHGTPKNPQELTAHEAILDLNERDSSHWSFDGGLAVHRGAEQGQLQAQAERETLQEPGTAGRITVAMRGRLAVNSAALTIRAALSGEGLVRAPDIFLAPHLASGALVELLPQFTGPLHPLHLLMPPASYRPQKVDAFATILRDQLARMQEVGAPS